MTNTIWYMLENLGWRYQWGTPLKWYQVNHRHLLNWNFFLWNYKSICFFYFWKNLLNMCFLKLIINYIKNKSSFLFGPRKIRVQIKVPLLILNLQLLWDWDVNAAYNRKKNKLRWPYGYKDLSSKSTCMYIFLLKN